MLSLINIYNQKKICDEINHHIFSRKETDYEL